MKKKSMTILFALAAITASAQSKFDAQSLSRLKNLKEQIQASALQKGAKAATEEQTISVVVRMNDGIDAKQLEGQGFTLAASRDNIAVVTLPLSRIMELNDNDGVRTISYGRKVRMKLTEANKLTGVDDVHSGKDLDMPYTGKGVIIGDIDTGFQPNHLMFLDKDGKSRFKYVFANKRTYDTDDAIASYTTDETSETHATHVMGIAGGKYESDSYSISGVATEADLAAVAIQGYTSEIITGIENMVNFSKQKNEPLVVNISLGDNYGPHDATDEMSQYINKVIDSGDAIICMAAGNEGNYPIAQKKTFTSADDKMTANIYCMHSAYGYATAPSVYFKSSKPFSFSLCLFDNSTKEIIKTFDPITGPIIKSYTSTGLNADADYAQNFSGTMRVDADNTKNGYYLELYAPSSITQKKSNVLLGYVITGEEGQKVEAYADEMTYLAKSFTSGYNVNVTPADGVTGDGTISNMASGTNAIIVGSYNSRDRGRYENNSLYSLASVGEKNALNEVSSFSSWGTVDDVSMPDIAAPGALIESSMNSYYMKNNRYESSTKGIYGGSGLSYYWSVQMGTSMATPYMSGVAALWLEADPTLKNSDIKEIAKLTAIKDNYVKNTKNPVQFGAGKIDAYNGLKEVLRRKVTALNTVSADKDMMFRQTGDNAYEAYIAGETAISVRIYDMNGRLLQQSRKAGDTASFSTAGMPKGIYAVELCGAKTSHKLKIAVK